MKNKNEHNKSRSSSLRALLGMLVSGIFLLWLFRSVEIDKIKTAFSEADKGTIAFAFVLMFFTYALRSMRWRIFFSEKPPSYLDSYRCLIVGFFMNNTLPARMGEFVRAHLGGKATGHSRSTVLATVAGERLADGLCISILFASLFYFFPGSIQSQNASDVLKVAVLFGMAGLGTVATLLCRDRVFAVLEKLAQIVPGHLSDFALVKIKKFIVGLEPILEPKRALLISVWSVLVWALELYIYFLVAKAFSVQLSLGGLALFLAVVNFSSLIPAAPGGIGVIEAIGTAALVNIGVNRETAFSMVALQHMIQILVVGLPGAYFFFRQMRGKLPESRIEDDLDAADLSDSRVADVSDSVPKSIAGQHCFESKPENGLWLSVVVPAFNEAERISRTLVSMTEYLDSRELDYEIIVVSDGSTDETEKVVAGFENLSSKVKILSYPNNKGKGYAVRYGVANAKGRLILFADADGATPIDELSRLESAMEGGSQIAIGSRALFSKDTDVETVWYRRFLGRIFNGFVNFIILPGIADTQCGFKLFRHDIAKDLFATQKADRFSFDVEILYLARKRGYKIAEVPINWTNIEGSKVDLVRDSIAMGFDIVRFRINDMRGRYKVY